VRASITRLTNLAEQTVRLRATASVGDVVPSFRQSSRVFALTVFWRCLRRRDSTARPSTAEQIVAVLLLTDARADERLIRAFHSAASDETRERADPEGRLLPARDDAEVGCAKDLASFSHGNRDPPNRAPELRGTRVRRPPSASRFRASDQLKAEVREEPGRLSQRNDLRSLVAVRPHYRNDSGAGVPARDLRDVLLAISAHQVLARSLQTVGSMQKFQPMPAALLDPRISSSLRLVPHRPACLRRMASTVGRGPGWSLA
jgi:hypothetical protein